VQHVGRFSFAAAGPRFTAKGNRSCAARGRKKSRNHSRGSEGGPQTAEQARLFPHPVVGATVASGFVPKDLMSVNKQVCWLRVRPNHFAFPSRYAEQWHLEAFVLDTAALPLRIRTCLSILPKAVAWGTRSRFNTQLIVWMIKEPSTFCILSVNWSTQFFPTVHQPIC